MQYAIGVVILPPKAVMEVVARLIDYAPNSVTKLNTNNCLPHISLAMGVLSEDKLGDVISALKDLSYATKQFEVAIDKTQTQAISNGKIISEAVPAPNLDLVNLHLQVMNTVKTFLTHDHVITSMFIAPPKVDEISTIWVKHYYDKQSPDDFQPHITLGEGSIKQPSQPISFIADTIALCHLGNYCTCRKVFAEFKLS